MEQQTPFQPLTKSLLTLLLLATFGYLFFRFGNTPKFGLSGLICYSLICWATSYGILGRVQQCFRINNGILIIGFLMTVYPLGFALSDHFLDNLAVIKQDNADQTSTYLLWKNDGTSQEKIDLPLTSFHISGDEGAHLAAVNALAVTKGNFKELKQMADSPEGHNLAYWINRSFRGHPLGFHLFYLPASNAPPIARLMASFVFLAAICGAYWAGQKLDSKSHYGLFTAIVFTSVAHLFWFHGFRVSSDVLPCIPTFIATGFFWASIHKQAEGGNDVKWCGLCLAVACSITHTAALVVLGFIPLLWMHHRKQFLTLFLWLSLPSTLVTIGGIALSGYIVSPENHGIIGRFFQETAHAKEFNDEGKDLLWMLKRLPRDMGIPMLLWTIWSSAIALKSIFNHRTNLYLLLSAFAILVPATTLFFAELRYTYPGWILIITGLGGQITWKHLTTHQRSICLSCLITFVLVKFLYLRIELATTVN